MHQVGVVGLSYRHAGVDEVARFALPKDELAARLTALRDLLRASEIMYVGTCNRVEVLFTTKSYASGNAAAVTRVATAVDMGAKFIAQHPEQATQLLAKLYPTMAPSAVAAAFKAGIQPSLAPNVEFTAAMWQNVNTILLGGGTISKAISTAPNTSWTNQYIDASAKAATVY